MRNKRASLNDIDMVLTISKVMNQILVKWWEFPQRNILFQTNQIWKYHFIMRKSVLEMFSSLVPMDQLFVSKILRMILTYMRLGKISSPTFLPQQTHLASSCARLTISIFHWKIPWVTFVMFYLLWFSNSWIFGVCSSTFWCWT